jgi:hypothetical protein
VCYIHPQRLLRHHECFCLTLLMMRDGASACHPPLTYCLWDAAGDPPARWQQEWDFYLGGARPAIKPGARVYMVYNGALRGYAPLVRIDSQGGWRFSLVRHGGAVAVTIPEFIQGFRGWRYRWWDRSIEVPFPDWQNPEACIGFTRPIRQRKGA